MPKSNFNVKAFKKVQNKPHSAQAIWFLNGFWADGMEKEAETVWDMAHSFYEISMGREKFYGSRSKNQEKDDEPEKHSLDQFQSHRFLEHVGETKTATELRRELATIDVDKNNKMTLTEYLMFKYGKNPQEVIDAPQGGNEREMKAAEAKLASARAASDELTERFEASQKAANQATLRATAAQGALKTSVQAQKKAKEALDYQEQLEAKSQAAQAAQKAAMDALNAEQAAFDKKCAKARSIAEDESKGNVARNRARNELKQLQSEDPLPLSRAKITQASSLKKANKAAKKAAKQTKKAQKLANSATDAAENAKAAADAADEAAADAKSKEAATQAALEDAKAQMAAATAAFEALKKQGGGVPQGKIFWMEREMKEIQKYMPGAGGLRRKKKKKKRKKKA